MPIGAPKSNKPIIRKKRRRGGIAGIIFIGSFAGLLVLVIGSLVFNELRSGLTQARADTLKAQAITIANVLAEAAVQGDPEPLLDENNARVVLKRLFREPGARLRLYSKNKKLIADSTLLYDEISVRELPKLGTKVPDIKKATKGAVENARIFVQGSLVPPQKALDEEIEKALNGEIVGWERYDDTGNRVISVSIPIQRVRAIVGVLTLETGDVSQTIDRERRALIPFIIAAILANLMMAAILAWLIARPLQKLADAAEDVALGISNDLGEEKLSRRPDEIGELAEALNLMINSLQERIDANESFAADVAHEIKNPLAAIRSSAELLKGNLKPEQREKLEANMLADLKRIDRLVTDISNASRLDAELARTSREKISLKELLESLLLTYETRIKECDLVLDLSLANPKDRLWVLGQDDALRRVFINLIDNAISFSPPHSIIRLHCTRKGRQILFAIDDEGSGIPEEALERVFERFYTHRPKDIVKFGTHSGLGLAIARQIIESHDGILYAQNRVENDKAIGARFIIELPAA